MAIGISSCIIHGYFMPRLSFCAGILALCLFPQTQTIAEDWPHWRGQNRVDITTESSGYENGKPWPPAPALWKINVGEGASSPIIASGTVYTIGWKNDSDTVRAINPKSGATVWEQYYPAPKYGRHAVGDQRMYRGATATPEFDPTTGLLYTLSCDGDLRAWDATKSGAPGWNLNLYEQFNVPKRPQITKRKNTLRDYGYTTAPFVFENWIIVEVGDPKSGNLHAFDKKTGKQVWASENRDVAGHAGALTPMTIDGVPCVAIATSYHALVVRLDGKNAGKTVAEFPWPTDFSNTIAGIAARGNELLIGSRYNHMAMAKVQVSLENGAREIWKNKLPSGVCTPVIHGDHVYFANKGIHCVEFKTGKLIWEGGKVGDAGSCLVTGDNRLLVWGNGGDLSLVETAKRSPEKITILAEKRGIFNEMAWPHVVLADRRIFCKTTDGELACFSLTGEKSATAPSKKSPKVEDLNFTAWDGNSPAGQIWLWNLETLRCGTTGQTRSTGRRHDHDNRRNGCFRRWICPERRFQSAPRSVQKIERIHHRTRFRHRQHRPKRSRSNCLVFQRSLRKEFHPRTGRPKSDVATSHPQNRRERFQTGSHVGQSCSITNQQGLFDIPTRFARFLSEW